MRLLICSIALAALLPAAAWCNDVNFESPPVHPIDLAPSGSILYAVHTADHRLVVFDVTVPVPTKMMDVMVGIEPVTVRARNTSEAWVVNHISDTISIFDFNTGAIVKTLQVGDEPTDVVFSRTHAFVCVSQEDLVRIYDLQNLDAPPTDVPLDASDPRSLAMSPDSMTVYVAALDSGNRTTIIPFETVDAEGGPPAPNPPMNPLLPAPPKVSLIVQHNGANWVDDAGGVWDAVVPYTMPDNDVFAISVSTHNIVNIFNGVGTTLFNVGVAPNGDLYVTNQEAFNLTRFEPNLRASFLENRITRIAGSSVTPHHLNTHINYADTAGNASERAMSLAIPLEVDVATSGEIYVAAFGSRKVGVLDAAGNVTRRIDVGEGPAGVVVDEPRNRLYVFNRFSSSLSVVDLSDDSSIEIPLGFDPSPSHVRDGRKFLYDGEISSAHGDLSCASCHVFGVMDNIAWDLGDPTLSAMVPVPPGQVPTLPDFHPMKGPMMTQSLKALPGTEPMHWRGDRTVFGDFSPAFVSLMGLEAELSPADFQLFEDFVFSIQYPGNPYRLLNGQVPPALAGGSPVNGQFLFAAGGLVGGSQCSDCHALPTGENGVIIPAELLLQDEARVVPQLRNLYEKTRFDPTASTTVRGYGFLHDGSVKDLFTFLDFPAFTFASDSDKRDVAAYLLAFHTGTHPAVGAQWTSDGSSDPVGEARLDSLVTQANFASVGLVAKGRVSGQARGWTYVGGDSWMPDKVAEANVGTAALKALAGPGSEITFTACVDGCQQRLGIDRDLDGFRDGDELDAGSDPGDPASTPGTVTGIEPKPTRTPTRLWMAGRNPAFVETVLGFEVGVAGPVEMNVYDVRGRLVRRLVRGHRPVGSYTQAWDLRNQSGQSVSSGIYFVRMKTVEAVRVERVTVIR